MNNAFETWLNDELKGLKYNLKHGAFNNATTINTLEVALAKHRELCHHDECKAQQIIAFEQGITEGYKKGQTDMIEKLVISSAAIESIIDFLSADVGYLQDEIEDASTSAKNSDIADERERKIYLRVAKEVWQDAIKKASESLGDANTRVRNSGLSPFNSECSPKPEKPRLDLCKTCWQMTNHSYNEKTGELTCLKCNPKTRLNPKGGRELKSSGIYPRRNPEWKCQDCGESHDWLKKKKKVKR